MEVPQNPPSQGVYMYMYMCRGHSWVDWDRTPPVGPESRPLGTERDPPPDPLPCAIQGLSSHQHRARILVRRAAGPPTARRTLTPPSHELVKGNEPSHKIRRHLFGLQLQTPTKREGCWLTVWTLVP